MVFPGKTTPKVPFLKDSGRCLKILDYFLLTFFLLKPPAISDKIQPGDSGHGTSKGIEKRTCGNSMGQLKKK